MTTTRGRYTMSTPFTDGQIFIPCGGPGFVASGGPTLNASGGVIFYSQTTAAATYTVTLSTLLRTGQLATAAVNQQQFGTAALVPGPSSVANTSDPSNFPPGFPPLANAVNPTITGGLKGPIPKGLQINWIDLMYSGVGTLTPSVGLAQIAFANNVAPAVTSLLTLNTNGLPTAAQANPYRARVTPTTIKFLTVDGTEVILTFLLTAGTSANFYGAILGVSFNYN